MGYSLVLWEGHLSLQSSEAVISQAHRWGSVVLENRLPVTDFKKWPYSLVGGKTLRGRLHELHLIFFSPVG